MSLFPPKWSALAVLIVLCAQLAGAQGQPPIQSTLSKPAAKPNEVKFDAWTVEALLDERDNLNKEITDLKNKIGWTEDLIAKRADKAQLQAKKKSTEEVDNEIDKLLGYAGLPGVPLSELDTRLDQRKSLAEEKQNRKAAVDAELSRRLDLERPKQTFKLEMSAVFAFLVGMVILGFFVMAYRDEKVRREIFAGQIGIQFVTLFSLVIAIILFGIIDVLEGKELAALLGGLSGYILGRATPTGAPGKGETSATPQPLPEVNAQPVVPTKPPDQAEQAAKPRLVGD